MSIAGKPNFRDTIMYTHIHTITNTHSTTRTQKYSHPHTDTHPKGHKQTCGLMMIVATRGARILNAKREVSPEIMVNVSDSPASGSVADNAGPTVSPLDAKLLITTEALYTSCGGCHKKTPQGTPNCTPTSHECCTKCTRAVNTE